MSRVLRAGGAGLAVLRHKPWGQWATLATAVLVPMALAAFAGMVIALGSTQLTLMIVGAVGGAVLLFVPTVSIVYGLLGLSLCGAGVLMYYARISQAHWLVYGLSLFLWLKLPIDALVRRTDQARTAVLPLSVCLLALFAVALVSTFVNETTMLYAMVGARNYIFVWSLAFAISFGSLNPQQLRNCILMLLVIAALQLPFAIQQHFMNFAASGSWDSVVGTMGGDPEGGGGSGPLALLSAFSMGLAASLWKCGQLRPWQTLAVLLLATASIMLAEVKAFFIFAPLMMGVVLLRELRRRPAWALGMAVLTLLLLGSTFTYYRLTYFNAGTAHQESNATDYVEYAIGADVKLSNNINRVTGEVSRIGAPLIWVKEGGFGGPYARWVGYGMRACRSSPTLGAGDAAKHFVFNLTTSTITAALWDLGVLGLLAIFAILLIGLVSAWRLSRDERIPAFHRAALEAMAGAFVLALVGLPYNDAMVDSHTLQIVYAFAVGYVMYWQKYIRAPADAPRAVL